MTLLVLCGFIGQQLHRGRTDLSAPYWCVQALCHGSCQHPKVLRCQANRCHGLGAGRTSPGWCSTPWTMMVGNSPRMHRR